MTESPSVVGARAERDGDVDVFGVYSPDLERVYLVPTGARPASEWCSLRVDPSGNNQRSGVRLAEDFALTPPR